MYAWVDWNGNLQFEETERIDMSQFDAANESHGTFVVPQTAVLDTVIMRVRNIYTTGSHVADPCNSYFGEVEDYSLVVQNPVLGIEDELGENELYSLTTAVFPNPTTGNIIIQHPDTELHEVRIFDIFGKKLIPASVKHEQDQTELNLGSVPPGLYLLELSDGKKGSVVKVVKQ
ncbi:MAG: GEVED domain-containing protein [Bacteroidia bacterium]